MWDKLVCHQQVLESGEKVTTWIPDLDKVKQVIKKNARGHAYFEERVVCSQDPLQVIVRPFMSMTEDEIVGFETANQQLLVGWPEVGTRAFVRDLTEQDVQNGWVVVQKHVYRYRVDILDRIYVRTVIYDYLATMVIWDSAA